MGLKYSILIISFLFFSQTFAQSIGFNAGYGLLSLKEVNNDLKDTENILSSAGLITSEPDKLNGGLYAEGNFKFSLGQFNLGISGNYISSTGGFTYSDITGSVEENYEVSTIELLALLDIILGSQNSITKFFIQLSGGYGFASALHTANFKLYQDPSQNFDIEHDISGNYFAGRVKLGLQLQLQNIILEIASGYRVANTSVLKGDLTQNGIRYPDQPVNDISGNGIEFDLSGVLLTAGISIQI